MEGLAEFIGMRREPHRLPALGSAGGEMPHARKKGQFSVQPFGELYSHLLVDVEILLAPNHLHRCLEPVQLRFKVILVSRKVRVVVGERVCRRHRSLGPSSGHVVLEFARDFKMPFLGQTSHEGVLQDLAAIAVQTGADLVHRRARFRLCRLAYMNWGLLNGAKSPTMIVLAISGFSTASRSVGSAPISVA